MKKKTPQHGDIPFSNEPPNELQIGLAITQEPRCACLILADCSGSMFGNPIAELNAGLQQLKAMLLEDQLACLRVELALVAFNEQVSVKVDFCPPDQFNPPALDAAGGTMLGAALLQGLSMLKARIAEYSNAGNNFYRPWLICLTDGKPSDDISEAARQIKEAEAKKRVAFFGVGVQGANMADLGSISLRPPLQLEGLKFTELFEWLSVNLSSVADSRPGDQVALTPPGWSAV